MCCVTVINIWRDEIARREYLREYFVNKKVALDLRVHSRAIENRIARTIHLHLRNRKWIANNVLREVLDVLTLMRRDAPTFAFFQLGLTILASELTSFALISFLKYTNSDS